MFPPLLYHVSHSSPAGLTGPFDGLFPDPGSYVPSQKTQEWCESYRLILLQKVNTEISSDRQAEAKVFISQRECDTVQLCHGFPSIDQLRFNCHIVKTLHRLLWWI